MVHQGYIEPHAAIASWSADGKLTVHASTQGAFALRDQLAAVLGLPLSGIRVVPTEVGGGFGGKIRSYLAIPASLLSRKSGCPVKVVMDRHEVFLGTGPTSGTLIRTKMGAKKNGKLTAARAELFYEAGAYPGANANSGGNAIFGCYDIPNGQIDGYDVVVNKPSTAAYRAPGVTPAVFAGEQVIDELAEKTGMDPLEFRLLNSVEEGTRRLDGRPHGSIGAREVLSAARECSHYAAPLEGRHRGRGIAYGTWGNWGAQSSCAISVNTDGTVALISGSVDLTGTRTSLAMQAAETLGIPVQNVSAAVGDTESVGFTNVSAGSRTTVTTGHAVVKAAREVIAKLKARAALLWNVPEESISFEKGVFTSEQDGSLRFSFQELAAELPQTGGPLTGVGNVSLSEWGAAFATHIADVEVDPETGKVELLRYTVVQDVGTAIHPGMVEGQMQGGATQGIGWGLFEGYDYGDQGEMLNPNLMDYKLPTALDVPNIETVIVEVPYPKHPFGIRGAGEIPIVPPPAAIANAIYKAVGVRIDSLPITPRRILEKLGVI